MRKRFELPSKGFTLIELLIVVAIIAILAAIAVPNFLEAQTRSKVSRAKSDIRTITTGLEAYRVDNNNYPPTPYVDVTFDSGVLRVVPNFLSTPIAYITTAGIQDPFMVELGDFQGVRRDGVVATYQPDPGYPGEPGSDPAAGGRYYYNLYRDYRRSSGALLGLLPYIDVVGEWEMASLGPNRQRDLVTITKNGTNFEVLEPYDPTNGTVSNGDIIRTQKLSDSQLAN